MCCGYSRRRETRIVPNNFNTIVKILLELLIQGSPVSLRCKQSAAVRRKEFTYEGKVSRGDFTQMHMCAQKYTHNSRNKDKNFRVLPGFLIQSSQFLIHNGNWEGIPEATCKGGNWEGRDTYHGDRRRRRATSGSTASSGAWALRERDAMALGSFL